MPLAWPVGARISQPIASLREIPAPFSPLLSTAGNADSETQLPLVDGDGGGAVEQETLGVGETECLYLCQ